MGLVTAFDMPGRQIFVNDVVDKKEDLGNAIALNSSLFNGARMIGPSIAGLLIVKAGEGLCFLVNSISFITVLIALAFIRTRDVHVNRKSMLIHLELREGLNYAFGFAPIRAILLLLFLTSMMGMPVMVLMPIFSASILSGGPETMGFLMAASGIGALIGAFFLASRSSVVGLVRIIPLAAALFGVGLVSFSFSRTLWLSILLGVVTGLGMMVQMASSNTLIQMIVDEDKRGRIMSLYITAFMGAAPLGSLMAGTLADRIGAPLTVMSGGCCCIAGALLFARFLPRLREQIRPVYVRLGILGDK
jgi:MFS family permease